MSNDDNDSSTNSGSNIGNYIIITLLTTILIVIYFVISGLVLYAIKVAASGILPTDINYYPYTDNKDQTKFGELISNIFITYTDPALSEKISFYTKNVEADNYNSSNMLLDILRKYKTNPDTSSLIHYFISIIESLLVFDYWILGKSLGFLNNIPEMLIILLGPMFINILTFLLVVVNYFYLMFLWFYEMSWFFKPNKKKQEAQEKQEKEKQIEEGLIVGIWTIFIEAIFGSKKSTDKSDSTNSMYDNIIGCIMVWLFTILFFILLILGWGFFPILLALYCLYSIVSYVSEVNDKKSNVGTIIWKLFRFYKSIITSIISFVFVSSTFSFLGVQFGIAALVVILMIAFFGMGISLFKQESIDDLTPIIETKSGKIGGNTKSPQNKPNAVNAANVATLLSQSGGGKDFIKILNKITNKIHKNTKK